MKAISRRDFVRGSMASAVALAFSRSAGAAQRKHRAAVIGRIGRGETSQS